MKTSLVSDPDTVIPISNSSYPAVYRRVLLKLSGEALMGSQTFGIDPVVVGQIADDIKDALAMGVQVAVVVGGGNIFRGVQNSSKLGMDRASADYVGMLATMMNALILQGVMKGKQVDTRVLSAISMDKVAEPYIRLRAVRHLEKGRLVIFGSGTGNPFFSTDTTAALRAAEIGADVILMAKNGVDGVYDDDPKRNPNSRKFDSLTYDDVLVQNLRVMDQTAISLCKDTGLPMIVFDFKEAGAIQQLLSGETLGTVIR